MASPSPQHERWWALLPVVGGLVSSLIGYWGRRREQKEQQQLQLRPLMQLGQPGPDDERARLSRLEEAGRETARVLADIRREQADDRRTAEARHEELCERIRALAEGSLS